MSGNQDEVTLGITGWWRNKCVSYCPPEISNCVDAVDGRRRRKLRPEAYFNV